MEAVKRTRILFLLDASSSMTLPWKDSSSRFDVASELLLRIIDSVYEVNPEVEFAVRTYGTSHPAQEKNCTDTKLEVPFNVGNIPQIKTRLKYILPVGYSPIAYSLEQASGNELSEPRKYDYSIIFITDGGESCNGDICISFNKFIAGKISVKPYVIGLDKNEKLSNYYHCMGNYLDVVAEEDLPKAVNMIVDANRRIISKTKTDEPIIKPIVVEPDVERNTFNSQYLLPPTLQRKHERIIPSIKFYYAKPGKVTIQWVFDEEKKPETTRKNLQSLTLFFENKKAIRALKVSARSFKVKKRTATLHFEIEEEVTRDMSGLSKVFLPEFPLRRKPLPKIKANTIALKKKLSFYLNYEEEVFRAQNGLSSIFLSDFPLKKVAAAKVKPSPIPLKRKLTLHLLIEDPIERKDVPFLAMVNLKSNSVPKIGSIKAKSYAIKKKTAQLNFTFPIDRDSIVFITLVPNNLKPRLRLVSFKANSYAIKKKTAQLYFTFPIDRDSIVFRTLVPNNLKPRLMLVSLKAKSYAIKKKTAQLNFTFPIDRDSIVFTTLVPHTLKPRLMDRKPIVSASTSIIKNKKAILYFTVEVPKKDTLYALKGRAFPKKIGYALSLPKRLPIRLKSNPVLHFTFDLPVVASKVKNRATQGDMDFTIKTEASAETTLQIFLIGEDGTMYPDATPKIEMVDTVTKDTIRFVRNVAVGSPKKEKIKAGVYDIFIREYNVARSYGVQILPNSNNKVTLELRRGTLYFAYSNDIHKKVNYHAVVKKRFAEKLVVRQSCAEVLKYDPGTYFVEISDMLPPFQAIVYIDFYVDYLISIPEPGTVQFTNTLPLGKVILQTVLGDGYANFYELNITGRPEDQIITLRHGVYRAIIPVDSKTPMAGTKVIEFKVVSTKNTELELK